MNKTQITNRVQDTPISTADSIGKASITILLTYMESQKKMILSHKYEYSD